MDSHFPFPARTYSGGDVAGAGVLPLARQPQLSPNHQPERKTPCTKAKNYDRELKQTRREARPQETGRPQSRDRYEARRAVAQLGPPDQPSRSGDIEMMSLTAVQRLHSKLSRFPEFRELKPEAQRHLLQLVCAASCRSTTRRSCRRSSRRRSMPARRVRAMSQYWGTGRLGTHQSAAYTGTAGTITNAISAGVKKARIARRRRPTSK